MPQPVSHQSRPSLTGFSLRAALGLIATVTLLAYLFTPDVSAWKLALAQRDQASPATALKHIDEALAWNPRNVAALQLRINLYERLNDTPAAIQAASDALQLDSLQPHEQQYFLQLRSDLYQRIGKHTEAIRDANQSLKLGEQHATGSDADRLVEMMQSRNFRAYVVARAAAEGEANRAQVEDALGDMRLAFAGLERLQRAHAQSAAPQQIELRQREASFLDTLAYLEMSAGNLRAALRDLNRVVQLCETIEREILRDATKLAADGRGEALRELRTMRAVVYHHRGEVLLAMGHKLDGELNILIAKRQGYSREQGKW
jgi:tetratricopeptide (TPR) repeat protein